MELSVSLDNVAPAPGSYLQGTLAVRLAILGDNGSESIADYSDNPGQSPSLHMAIQQYNAFHSQLQSRALPLSSVIDHIALVDSLHLQVIGKLMIDQRKIDSKRFAALRPFDDSAFLVFDTPRHRVNQQSLVHCFTTTNDSREPVLFDYHCWLPASLPPSFAAQSIKLVYYIVVTAFKHDRIIGELRLPFTVRTSPLYYHRRDSGESLIVSSIATRLHCNYYNPNQSHSDTLASTSQQSATNPALARPASTVDELVRPHQLLFTPSSIVRTKIDVLNHSFESLSIKRSSTPSLAPLDTTDDSGDESPEPPTPPTPDYESLELAEWQQACSEIITLNSPISHHDSHPPSLDVERFLALYYRNQSFNVSDSIRNSGTGAEESVPIVRLTLSTSAYRMGDLVQGALHWSGDRCEGCEVRLVYQQTIHKQYKRYDTHTDSTITTDYDTFTVANTANSDSGSQFVTQIPFDTQCNYNSGIVDGRWALLFRFSVRKPAVTHIGTGLTSWLWMSTATGSDSSQSVEWTLPLDVWPLGDDNEDVTPGARTLLLPRSAFQSVK